MVAHCVGSLVNYAALLSGRSAGKIRNLISMQLAANPIANQFNELRSGIYLPEALEMLGVDGFDASPESTADVTEKLFNSFVKDVSHYFPYRERCQSYVCHR